MTNEQKQLLLKVLCEQLPYGLKFLWHSWNYKLYRVDVDDELANLELDIEDIKPYLRPISSMPVEERSAFERISNCLISGNDFDNIDVDSEGNLLYIDCDVMTNTIDWLNAHHFDYRGLIEKGLALEAPEDMYKTQSF